MAQNAVIFPTGAPDVAGIARMSEKDANADTDRNKALSTHSGSSGSARSRHTASAPNYAHSGVRTE